MENQPQTKISVRIESRVNLGDYEHVQFSIQVDDFVREVDKTTGAAIDRITSLVETKLVEKLAPYKE